MANNEHEKSVIAEMAAKIKRGYCEDSENVPETVTVNLDHLCNVVAEAVRSMELDIEQRVRAQGLIPALNSVDAAFFRPENQPEIFPLLTAEYLQKELLEDFPGETISFERDWFIGFLTTFILKVQEETASRTKREILNSPARGN